MNLVAADLSPLTFDRRKFEPTHVGCYQPEPIQGSDACAKAKGKAPCPPARDVIAADYFGFGLFSSYNVANSTTNRSSRS